MASVKNQSFIILAGLDFSISGFIQTWTRCVDALLDGQVVDGGYFIGVARLGVVAREKGLERAWCAYFGIARIEYQIEVLGDARGLHAVLHFDVRCDGDVDPVLGRRDAVEKRRVVQRRVPGHFEAEKSAVVVRFADVLRRYNVK